MIEDSTKGFNINDGDEKLIENMKNYLENSKVDGEFSMFEFAQIENQIKKKNIMINKDENKISLELDIHIYNSYRKKNKEEVFVSYSYNKIFKKHL